MKFFSRFLPVFLLIVIFSVGLTESCVRKVSNVIMKTTTTVSPILSTLPPQVEEANSAAAADLTREEAIYFYANFRKQERYFLEIQTSIDNSVQIYELKELPPIYSQMINNESYITPTKGDLPTPPAPDEKFENVTEVAANSNLEEATPTEISEMEAESNLSIADAIVREDWGGNCSSFNWIRCSQLTNITLMNVFSYIKDKDTLWQHLDLDCLQEPIMCLHNKWTANRCHILCMSRCNREILLGWDGLVSHDGQCKYMRKRK